MSLAIDNTTTNLIAYKVFGTQYSSCSTAQKTLIDGAAGGSGGSSGEAYNALVIVRQIAQWFDQAGIASADDTFQSMLVSKACQRLVSSERPERAANFKAEYEEALDGLISTFSKSEVNVATTQGTDYSVRMIRFNVIDHCLRRTPRIFPQISTIDAELQTVMNLVWNKPWNFRTKSATGTVDTSSVVTITPSSGTFDSVATRRIYFTDQADTWMTKASRDDIHRFKANPSASTGRPQFFEVMKNASGTSSWLFYPAPDQTYSFRCSVYIAAPTISSSASDTTALDDFPVAFRPIIRDMTRARVLMNYKQSDGQELMRTALSQLDNEGKHYFDSRGDVANSPQMRDVYGDIDYLAGASQQLGGDNGGWGW